MIIESMSWESPWTPTSECPILSDRSFFPLLTYAPLLSHCSRTHHEAQLPLTSTYITLAANKCQPRPEPRDEGKPMVNSSPLSAPRRKTTAFMSRRRSGVGVGSSVDLWQPVSPQKRMVYKLGCFGVHRNVQIVILYLVGGFKHVLFSVQTPFKHVIFSVIYGIILPIGFHIFSRWLLHHQPEMIHRWSWTASRRWIPSP